MKRVSIIFSTILLLTSSCSKNEDEIFEGKSLKASYVFSPGGSVSQINYKNNGNGFKGTQNITSFNSVNDNVRIGDEISLTMVGTNRPVGNFSIRLNINGKQVKEVSSSGSDLNLNLDYKVSETDFE